MEKLAITSTRLEAFSDGVIAIIVTIMVLEFKVPHDADPAALLRLWPIFLSYGLSFLMVAVYWINHHYLFHLAKRVDAKILWANNLLLFFLSLVPFFTAYMNEHERNSFSTAMYSGILMVCALAFTILRRTIRVQSKNDPKFKLRDKAAAHKNWLAVALYLLAIGMAFVYSPASLAINFLVGAMYAMPEFYLEK